MYLKKQKRFYSEGKKYGLPELCCLPVVELILHTEGVAQQLHMPVIWLTGCLVPEDRLTWGDVTERELTWMVPQVFSYQHSYQISQKKKHSEGLQRLIFHNTTPTHVRSSQCSSTNCHPYSHPGTEYVIPSFTMKIHCYRNS